MAVVWAEGDGRSEMGEMRWAEGAGKGGMSEMRRAVGLSHMRSKYLSWFLVESTRKYVRIHKTVLTISGS